MFSPGIRFSSVSESPTSLTPLTTEKKGFESWSNIRCRIILIRVPTLNKSPGKSALNAFSTMTTTTTTTVGLWRVPRFYANGPRERIEKTEKGISDGTRKSFQTSSCFLSDFNFCNFFFFFLSSNVISSTQWTVVVFVYGSYDNNTLSDGSQKERRTQDEGPGVYYF